MELVECARSVDRCGISIRCVADRPGELRQKPLRNMLRKGFYRSRSTKAECDPTWLNPNNGSHQAIRPEMDAVR